MNIEIVFLIILSMILIWQFFGYPIFMAFIALRNQPKIKDYTYKPFVTILIPTYNEEKVIENRIKNLKFLDYPKDKFEVLIVDSGSTDRTINILNEIHGISEFSDMNIKIISEDKRNGKASAINFGKKYARGDIILVTDANTIFNNSALREMMPHFKDPKVGGVGGRLWVANSDDKNAVKAAFYWDLENVMRIGEAALDSACLFQGEINAWRKDLVDANIEIISEDLDMSIKIRQKNYKIEYEPNAIAYEPSPTTVSDQIIQRKRTCIGTIKTIFHHWKYIIFTGNLYTSLILPSHKFLAVISPFILLSIIIPYLFIWNLPIIFIHITMMALISIFLYIVLIYLLSNFKITKKISNFSFYSILNIILYVLLNEYLILLAWKDFITGKYSEKWEKVESTRNNPLNDPIEHSKARDIEM
jgi:biofilm PGA synthesis N-glycosyltransferase PgaC